jgi:possible thiol:disulfide interchange protein dsbE
LSLPVDSTLKFIVIFALSLIINQRKPMKRFLFFPLWLILCYCCICNAQTSLPTNAIKIGKCVVRGKVPAMLAMKSSLTVVYNDFLTSSADIYDLSIDAEGNVSGEVPLYSLYAYAGVKLASEENAVIAYTLLSQNDTIRVLVNDQKNLKVEGAKCSSVFKTSDWLTFVDDGSRYLPRKESRVIAKFPVKKISEYPSATTVEDRKILVNKLKINYYAHLLDEMQVRKVILPISAYAFLNDIVFDDKILYASPGTDYLFYFLLSDKSLNIPSIGDTPIPEWKEKLRRRLAKIPYKPNELFCDLMACSSYYFQLETGKLLTAQQLQNIHTGFSSGEWDKLLLLYNEQEVKTQARSGHFVDCAEKGQPQTLKEILAQHKGKPVIVDFWYGACGPCAVMSKLLYKVLAEEGFENVELLDMTSPSLTSVEAWQNMKGKQGGWHYMLKDAELEGIMKQQQAEGFPTLMFYDKSHQLVKTKVGQMSEEELRQSLNIIR